MDGEHESERRGTVARSVASLTELEVGERQVGTRRARAPQRAAKRRTDGSAAPEYESDFPNSRDAREAEAEIREREVVRIVSA